MKTRQSIKRSRLNLPQHAQHALLALTLSLTCALPSWAADPLIMAGTEPEGTGAGPTLFGFMQPRLEGYLGGEVSGLTGALEGFNGELPSFNRTGSTQLGGQVARARIGLRGSVAHTAQKVSYFMLLEFGQVPITRTQAVVPVDLSATFSYVPGVRLRVGYFKLPTMEEILLPLPAALEFIQFSTTLARLLNENPIEGGALEGGGRFVGGASAFRDLGVQAFESFERGAWRLGYALMASSGGGSLRTQSAHKDLSARLELAYHWGGQARQLRRPELKLALWRLQGERELEVNEEGVGGITRDFERVRQGATLRLERGAYWGMVELAQGRGALEVGTTHPFVGGRPVVRPEGEAWGVVVQGGVRLFGAPLPSQASSAQRPELALKARFEQYHQDTQSDELLRVFQTTTLGAEYRPAPRVRLELNYELRSLEAPSGSTNAQRIATSMGDRVLTQATLIF